MRQIIYIVLLLALGVLPDISFAEPGYTIASIETLGGRNSSASSINDHGQIVGQSETAGGETHAFLWTSANGMQDLGTLGGNWSAANSINNYGEVVGFSLTPAGKTRAFLWTPSQGMRDLGSLGGDSIATDLNDRGQVVGYSQIDPLRVDLVHAFRWSSSNGMRDLGSLQGVSEALAINNQGEVVGWSRDANGRHVAVRWASGGGLQDLGIDAYYSQAEDINELGQVLGYQQAYAVPEEGDDRMRAFYWLPSNGAKLLVAIGQAERWSFGMNDYGQAVGFVQPQPNSFERAFVWSSRTGFVDLATLGSDRSSASDINNLGEIVGWSTSGNGATYAVRWVPVQAQRLAYVPLLSAPK